jgi:hypothetical protein
LSRDREPGDLGLLQLTFNLATPWRGFFAPNITLGIAVLITLSIVT